MEFLLLGPLQVRDSENHQIRPPRGTAGRLLALLLLYANRGVESERLIKLLWSTEKVDSARANLRQYVSTVRRFIDSTPDSLAQEKPQLRTVPSGYLLELDPAQIDISVFENLTHKGKRALASNDAERGQRLLEQALKLWRGPVAQGMRIDVGLQPELIYWNEMRTDAQRSLILSLLALGDHGPAVAQLRLIISEDPYREEFWAMLMVALYRSGRKIDAIRAYNAARKHLAWAVDVEPTGVLHGLRQAILQDSDPQSLRWSLEAVVARPSTVA